MEELALLAQALVSKASAEGISFCSAESITGGLFAEVVTGTSGASKAFAGSAVTYQTRSKLSVLGVSEATLQDFGAVSPECATEMAENVRQLYDTDYALSFTGVAGPDKDENSNDIGTVFIALAGEDGTGVLPLKLDSHLSRNELRVQAAKRGLTLLLDFI